MGSSRVLRALFGAVVFVVFIWFIFVGILAKRATKTMTAITTSSSENFKHLKFIVGESNAVHHDLDLNYVSKRRVPNGPDPIHNRRAGKSRQPPGRT